MEKIAINLIREEEMVEAVTSLPSDSTHHQTIVKAALGLHKTTLDAAKLTAVATPKSKKAAPAAVAAPKSQKAAPAAPTPPAGNTAGVGATGAQTWPAPDPNDSNPPWPLFDPTVPNDLFIPGAYTGEDVYSKFYAMLQYISTHPDNKTAMMDFMAYAANLSKSQFANDPELQKLLSSPALSVNGMSIYEYAGYMLVNMYFYSDGTPSAQADTEKFCSTLASMFDASGANSPFKGLVNYLNYMANPGPDDKYENFTAWVQTQQKQGLVGPNGLPAVTYAQWCQMEGTQWGNFINGSINSQGQQTGGIDFGTFRSMYGSDMMNYIQQKYHLSAFQTAIIFLYSMTDSDQNSQLSGYGDTAKWLAKETNQVNNALTDWTNGNFTSQSAMDWMQTQVGIQWDSQDTLAGGTKTLVNPQIDSILNIQVTVGGKTTTLGALYASGDGAGLASALNSFQPSGSTTQPPPQYQLITNALKQIAGAFTNQSQVVSTQMTQLTNYIELTNNSATASLNNTSTGLIAVESVAVNNQRPN